MEGIKRMEVRKTIEIENRCCGTTGVPPSSRWSWRLQSLIYWSILVKGNKRGPVFPQKRCVKRAGNNGA